MESVPKDKTPLLIVDDDTELLSSMRLGLMSAGFQEPAVTSDSRRVMDLMRRHRFHLVLLDILMPHQDGISVLKQLKTEYPDVECVMITAVDDVATAVQAMQFGAYDYLVKPFQKEKLVIAIKNALEKYDLRYDLSLFEKSPSFAELSHGEAFAEMIAEDEAMALVFHKAETYASNDYNLVLTGETGTGKEMLAHIIHRISSRCRAPFVAVNMASFSKQLFEDELFGHAKGAFTGADSERRGFFEEAQSGTLFLDEIADLDLDLQAKLLRVIQERELYRLGSTRARNIDLRIICATNRKIHEQLQQGRFRSDLYYRLNTGHIHIPPLRQRKMDILPLARYFLDRHARLNNKPVRAFSPDLAEWLIQYAFPGNVRELENMIAAAVVSEPSESLSLSSMPGIEDAPAPEPADGRAMALAEVEKRHIQRVLELTGGNRTQAARLLKIGLRTLQRKLKTF